MHILFITNNFPPIVDGVGDYTFHLAREFVKNGHEIVVVCKENAQIPPKVYGIEVKAIIKIWNKKAAIPIIKLIGDYQISWVILQYVPHGFQRKGLPFALISVMKQIKSTGVKIMVFCHEVAVSYIKGESIKRFFLSFLMKYVTKEILQMADRVATNIEYYQEMINKLIPQNESLALIPIASNVPSSTMSKEDLFTFKHTIAPNGEIIISFFGVRQIKTSLKALNNLIERGENIKVLFIGKTILEIGEYINYEKYYYRTGILDLQNIDSYLLITDIFILPESNTWGCSFKSGSLLAAFNDGIAVLSSKGLLTSEKLIDKHNILFTDFENAVDIEEKLISLIHNAQFRKQLGIQAKLTATAFYWENIYAKYEFFLELKHK